MDITLVAYMYTFIGILWIALVVFSLSKKCFANETQTVEDG